jgi:adenylate cyclase
MLRLVANGGHDDERAVEVRVGAITIGRTKDNDVFVLHKSLSRQHARLEHDGKATFIVDLDSKNGTFVNGARVTRAEVRPGDAIRCGDVPLELRDGSRGSGATWVPSTIADSKRDPSQLSIEEILSARPPSGATSLRLAEADAATRARDRLQVLLKVGQLLSAPHGLDDLLRDILDLLLRIMDVDRVALLMVEESGELVPRVLKSARGDAPGRFYSEHIVGWVRDNGVAALFADAKLDERVGAAESILSQSICSSMCAPLRAKDRLLGVLYVDNLTTPNRFSAEDLDFLSAFAGQAAVAIENSMLWKRLEQEAVVRSTLTRFFPPATIKKLTETGGASLDVIETEVTALFADVSDFTAMSARMEPRAVVDMLNEYFPHMADVVFRNGGTLEKYIGDALMAVWGAPFAGADDVDDAVRAAVEMQRGLAELNARWARTGRPAIRIHVGINTGRVAAGNIGSERYLQYATIGDATNVASRVCGVAAPGQIVITEATRSRLRKSTWPLAPLPAASVKGKEQPLQLHAVQWEDQK